MTDTADRRDASTPARLLIVDDEATERETSRLLLGGMGFEVNAVDGALAALRLVEMVSFDAFVTDIFMPGMDGIELILALRRSHLNLPIVPLVENGSFTIATAARVATALGATADRL